MLIARSDEIDEGIAVHRKFWKDEHFRRICDQLFEEMSELEIVLLKARREDGSLDRLRVFEELADVAICLEHLSDELNIDNEGVTKRMSVISTRLIKKLERLAGRKLRNRKETT